VCRFYDTEKREGAKEKDSIYIQRIVEENFDALLPIATLSHSPPPDMQLLRYGSWGERCACILWYREERRRKTRDIYRRHQPLQP
jgi:hypothetical protein